MTATFWQKGVSIDYKNETSKTIPVNTVVSLGSRIAVAGTDIKPGEIGSLITEGVFILNKSVNLEIEVGTSVFFDGVGITVPTATEITEENTTSNEQDTPSNEQDTPSNEQDTPSNEQDTVSTLICAGWAIETSSADDTTVKVKIG